MSAPKYTVSLQSHTFACQRVSENRVDINGELFDFDLRTLEAGLFSLILGGKSYVVHCAINGTNHMGEQPSETLSRKVSLSVNGTEYIATVDDERSILLKSYFRSAHVASATQVIIAPMPGLISKIEVAVGATVTKSQGLLVLEAMKMENEIRSMEGGLVKEIHVRKGDTVEKNQKLLTLEEV